MMTRRGPDFYQTFSTHSGRIAASPCATMAAAITGSMPTCFLIAELPHFLLGLGINSVAIAHMIGPTRFR